MKRFIIYSLVIRRMADAAPVGRSIASLCNDWTNPAIAAMFSSRAALGKPIPLRNVTGHEHMPVVGPGGPNVS